MFLPAFKLLDALSTERGISINKVLLTKFTLIIIFIFTVMHLEHLVGSFAEMHSKHDSWQYSQMFFNSLIPVPEGQCSKH